VAGVALAAAIAGLIAALHYHRRGLTLTHYDARGHLIVARRIADNITPGWQQIGAVWLPLPHLLNALPVQIDALYRTGASGVAIAVASFAVATAAIASIVMAITGSEPASIAAAAVFMLNPNVLYLQSTPMTEPLLIALTTVAVAALMNAIRDRSAAAAHDARDLAARAWPGRHARSIGILFALACLTRYEAWPVTAAALALAASALWLRGERIAGAAAAVGRVARYPGVAIAGFAIFSRVVVGQWFVAGDFFVPENKALGDWWLSMKEIAWGTRALSSEVLVWLGAVGIGSAVTMALIDRERAHALVAASLGATAAIPLVAFHNGHPFRIRYMVPLLAIEAIGCGVAAGLIRRLHFAGAALVLAIALVTLRPLDARAPMVVEAQWDAPNLPERARVTACLGPPRPGVKIMASMGSLGHYMQEASAAGYHLRDFLHEGNGDIWLAAILRPRPFADWILIEEKAEGGDMLARIAREQPRFLEGYTRTCEGAGLALYRRNP
jgi:hypothetical protein